MRGWDAVLAALPAFIAALGALIAALRGLSATKEVHLSINSRMDDLLKTSKEIAYREGQDQPTKPRRSDG